MDKSNKETVLYNKYKTNNKSELDQVFNDFLKTYIDSRKSEGKLLSESTLQLALDSIWFEAKRYLNADRNYDRLCGDTIVKSIAHSYVVPKTTTNSHCSSSKGVSYFFHCNLLVDTEALSNNEIEFIIKSFTSRYVHEYRHIELPVLVQSRAEEPTPLEIDKIKNAAHRLFIAHAYKHTNKECGPLTVDIDYNPIQAFKDKITIS